MKLYFDALGCPKAMVDAERMVYYLGQKRHEFVADPQEADAIIVNTCGFIGEAKKENIDAILHYAELKKTKPGLKLIVSGCLSERYSNELAESIPEIDRMIGVRDLKTVTEALEKPGEGLADQGEYRDGDFTSERSLVFSGLHYAYLKIAEGCSRGCSFCAIPGIRGKHRSRPMEKILEEAVFLKEQGISELILISEDTLYYGLDLYGKKRLPELLERLSDMGFEWIRVMYLYPEKDAVEVVRVMSKRGNICRYVDMPLQHADEAVLRTMNRAGNASDYLKRLEEMRSLVPEIAVRTTFIVGHPGEDEAAFENLMAFIGKARFDRVGFFTFSAEENTPSYSMKHAPTQKETRRRIQELSRLQAEISTQMLSRRVGQTVRCIQDGESKSKKGTNEYFLRSEWDAPEIDGRVLVRTRETLDFNDPFCKVRITGVSGAHDLSGELIFGDAE